MNNTKRKALENGRYFYAKQKILSAGCQIVFTNETTIRFIFNGHEITMYPYTGWHTGKGIKDGRGIENLIKQIKK